MQHSRGMVRANGQPAVLVVLALIMKDDYVFDLLRGIVGNLGGFLISMTFLLTILRLTSGIDLIILGQPAKWSSHTLPWTAAVEAKEDPRKMTEKVLLIKLNVSLCFCLGKALFPTHH